MTILRGGQHSVNVSTHPRTCHSTVSPTLSVHDAWMAEESLIVPAMDSRQCREDRIHRIYRRRVVAVVNHRHLGRYTCRGWPLTLILSSALLTHSSTSCWSPRPLSASNASTLAWRSTITELRKATYRKYSHNNNYPPSKYTHVPLVLWL